MHKKWVYAVLARFVKPDLRDSVTPPPGDETAEPDRAYCQRPGGRFGNLIRVGGRVIDVKVIEIGGDNWGGASAAGSGL